MFLIIISALHVSGGFSAGVVGVQPQPHQR